LNFQELNLDSRILEGLDAMGFKAATPIQEQAIPAILNQKDILACAQTGTGKTAAFILPVIHKIINAEGKGINTLVIVPTRELAQQIDQQIEGLAYFAPVTSMAVFGGGDGLSWEAQKKSLKEGVDIVVATPGRLLAMMNMDILDFSCLRHLILDEADRMLDMGFHDDILKIIRALPPHRQNLLFSATMPPKMASMARKILVDPVFINLSLSKPAEGVSQQAYVLYDNQKDKLLLDLLKNPDFDPVLIFASTKIKVKRLGDLLKQQKVDVKAFHSDLEQKEREGILRDFKNRNLRVIVATDVLSRGIDVDNISLVINYDAPGDPEDYVHRVGRTARAARTGVAITFVGIEDQRKFSMVERLIGYEVPKPALPQWLGEAPAYSPSSRSSGTLRHIPSHKKKQFSSAKSFDKKAGGHSEHKKSESGAPSTSRKRFFKPGKNQENRAPKNGSS